MVGLLNEISGQSIKANYGPERPGDVKHSKANIDKISKLLNYQPVIRFKEGLEDVFNWYKAHIEILNA